LVGFRWVEVVPSPKLQLQEVGEPDERSLKVTVWPVVGEVGDQEKLATGAEPAAVTVIDFEVEFEPAEFETVSETV
jgi:hypothetical protein